MSVDQYRQNGVPVHFNAQVFTSPMTDEASAEMLKTKTFFAKVMAGFVALLILGLTAIIVVDSKNEYDSMVVDEELKIENCVKSYEENRCHPHQRVPALNSFCLELEMCINSDPSKVAKRSAALSILVAENANKLFGSLKLKTVLVISILLFGSIISCNLFLGTRSTRGSFEYAKKEA